jgi:hypothetical protein
MQLKTNAFPKPVVWMLEVFRGAYPQYRSESHEWFLVLIRVAAEKGDPESLVFPPEPQENHGG